MNIIEQTLSIIKPDAVERNLQDKIKSEFKSKGFEILNEKKIHISKEEAEKFYKVNCISNHFIMSYVRIYHLDLLS